MEEGAVETHVFLGTNVLYFTWKIRSDICLVNPSPALRDKLCLAALRLDQPLQCLTSSAFSSVQTVLKVGGIHWDEIDPYLSWLLS